MKYKIFCRECGILITEESEYSKEYLERGDCIQHLTCKECYKPKRNICDTYTSYFSMHNTQYCRYSTHRNIASGFYADYARTKLDQSE